MWGGDFETYPSWRVWTWCFLVYLRGHSRKSWNLRADSTTNDKGSDPSEYAPIKVRKVSTKLMRFRCGWFHELKSCGFGARSSNFWFFPLACSVNFPPCRTKFHSIVYSHETSNCVYIIACLDVAQSRSKVFLWARSRSGKFVTKSPRSESRLWGVLVRSMVQVVF